MVTVLNLGSGAGKSWLSQLIPIAALGIGAYLLYRYITGDKAPTGGAGGGNGATIPTTSDTMQETLGLLGETAQKMGSGFETQNTLLNDFLNTATGIWKANPFTFGTGAFIDWIADYGNVSGWGNAPPDNSKTGGGNGGGSTGGGKTSFVRTAPAPATQTLSLPAKMHETIPNLVIPVIPKDATPSFTMAIRELFPAQKL